jgi:hypothetical protein
MREVTVLTGPPGCGKSDWLREDAIRMPGRYLFFAPTTPLIEEQFARFAAEAPNLPVYRADFAAGPGSVKRRLNEAAAAVQASGREHAVVFATHDALMRRDLSAFQNWHFRIDEAPDAVKSGEIPMGRSRAVFEEHLDLTPIDETDWSEISLKGPATSWREWANDQMTEPFVDFFKRIESKGVFGRATDWKAIDRLDWLSVWTPASLPRCDTIHIAGASYHKSLGAIVAQKGFRELINFVDRPVPHTRSGQPAIRIHYFTCGHEPSTKLWDSSEGRRRIKAVCDHLAVHVPDLGYWSGNDDVLKLMEWRVAGDCVLPKVAGQNKWRELTSCAIIYSSQPVPSDQPIKDFLGISDKEILASREEEDILQFAMRGAIRNKDYDGTYDVYLYSKRQAEMLAEQFRENGIGRSIDLVAVHKAGIMELARKQSANSSQPETSTVPKPRVTSHTGKLIQPKSARRNAARALQKAGETPKKLGRPSKAPELRSDRLGAGPENRPA